MSWRTRLKELWTWRPPVAEPDLHPYHDVLAELRLMGARLGGLERRLGLDGNGTSAALVRLEPRPLHCGHVESSFATWPDGQTQCVPCHQTDLLAQSAEAVRMMREGVG